MCAQTSSEAFVRLVFELWPDLFIAISVAGFAYIVVKSAR